MTNTPKRSIEDVKNDTELKKRVDAHRAALDQFIKTGDTGAFKAAQSEPTAHPYKPGPVLPDIAHTHSKLQEATARTNKIAEDMRELHEHVKGLGDRAKAGLERAKQSPKK